MTVIECSQKVRSVCPYGETCGGGEYKEGSDCDKFAESLQNKKAHKPGVGPVSRERVEKVWRGCEKCNGAGEYGRYAENLAKILLAKYCPHCGRPLTDEAVDILWKRLEAMQDEAETV